MPALRPHMRNVDQLNDAGRAVLARNNVHIAGHGTRPMVFCPGYGTDQTLWNYLIPYFEDEWRIVLFDHVGTGHSDRSAYFSQRYQSLDAYASDVIEIFDALDLDHAVVVGHSIGGIIGMRAVNHAPGRTDALVMIDACARYLNDGDYIGGFERADLDEFVFLLQSNHETWSSQITSLLSANTGSSDALPEPMNAYTKLDHLAARQFAEAALFSDSRDEAAACDKPTLIVQSTGDIIVPAQAARHLHKLIKSSEYAVIEASGHFPHVIAAEETAAVMRSFLHRTDS